MKIIGARVKNSVSPLKGCFMETQNYGGWGFLCAFNLIYKYVFRYRALIWSQTSRLLSLNEPTHEINNCLYNLRSINVACIKKSFFLTIIYVEHEALYLPCTLRSCTLWTPRKSFTSARARSTAGPHRSRSNGLSRWDAIRTPTLYTRKEFS